MKSYIYRVPENKSTTNGIGDCSKGLLIVLKIADYNANKETLNGLLKAINLNENDCRIILLESEPITLNDEISRYHVSSVIIFGITPSEVGIMANTSNYFWYKLEKFDFLTSHSIADLNADKTKKMNLWKCLQAKFLS